MALEKRAACQWWHIGSAAHIVQNSRRVACQPNPATSVSCGSEQHQGREGSTYTLGSSPGCLRRMPSSAISCYLTLNRPRMGTVTGEYCFSLCPPTTMSRCLLCFSLASRPSAGSRCRGCAAGETSTLQGGARVVQPHLLVRADRCSFRISLLLPSLRGRDRTMADAEECEAEYLGTGKAKRRTRCLSCLVRLGRGVEGSEK